MMFYIVLIFIISLIFVLVNQIGSYNEKYWKKQGVKYYKKNKIFGVFWDYFTKNGAMFEHFGNLYREFKNEPAVGFGFLGKPALFIIDVKNIHHALVDDFNAFNHRGAVGIKGDKLADNILFMSGNRWKLIHDSLSPLFTPKKIKSMYNILQKLAEDFVVEIKSKPDKWNGDSYMTFKTFCNSASCNTMYGITPDSIFNSPFLKVVDTITSANWRNNIIPVMMTLSPKLAGYLGMKFFKEHERFLIEVMTDVLKEREKGNGNNNDFVDLAFNLMKNGTMKDSVTGYEIEPTYTLMAAQATFMLVAGVDPTASIMFMVLVELGRHPAILAKVHKEIDETFEKYGNNLPYEAINEMVFIGKVIAETLRKYPPIGFLSRQCIKETILPVGNIKVKAGTKVIIPIYSIHHDPVKYPEPNLFNPDRFVDGYKLSSENYLPFGMGNRMCIAFKYAKVKMVIGLAHFLRLFTVKTIELDGPKFKSHITLVRPTDADVQFIPRNEKCNF